LGRVPRSILSFFTVFGLKILYKIIEKKQGRPDIMHAHFTNIGYAATKLKKNTGLPLVITEHSSEINKKKIDKDLYNLARVAYKSADALISVSTALASKINYHFKIKSLYIPNIVDTAVFCYKSTEIFNEDYIFVSVGNLIEIKQMDLTIETFYLAFRDNPKIKLIIYGDGPERKKLSDLIYNFGLNKQIKLMGQCSRDEISNQLAKSNCFVLPSRTETFGVVYIEAMAMGLPVIATKCGGPEGFVNESNGILIDVDNKEQLVEAMKYMYNNIDTFDRKSIARETLEKFSPKVVAMKILEVYETVLTKKH